MEVGTVRLVVVCDVYSQEANAEGSGGYAQLATLVRQLRTEHSLVCLCGDFLAGSSLADKFKGENVVAVLNEIGVDVVVFGNHEFDYGDDVLLQRMAESSAVWLGSNVIDKRTGAPFGGSADRHCVTFSFPAAGDASGQAGDAQRTTVQLGMFGVCTDDTKALSYPSDAIEFTNVDNAAREALDALDEEGADLVVGLTHLTLAEDLRLAAALATHRKSRNRLADSSQQRRRQAVAALLGGHDHLTHSSLKDGILVMKCGQDAHHVGVIDIHVRASPAGLSFHRDWRMIANRHVAADTAVQQLVASYKAAVHSEHDAAYLQEVLTTVELGPLSTLSAEVRTRSTFVGNLLADCLRDMFRYADARPATGGANKERQADLAIINSGTIRGNCTYPSGTSLTRLTVMEEFPMRLLVDVVELTGAQLRMVLEQHLAKYPEPIGSFPNVSRNVAITFDGRKPRLCRVLSLEVDGLAVTEEDRYHVVTSSFLSGGGDGCTAYAEGEKVAETDTKMLSLLDTYLSQHHPRLADASNCENRVRDVSC